MLAAAATVATGRDEPALTKACRRIFAVAVIGAYLVPLSACSPGRGLLITKAAPQRGEPVTAPIALIADSQLHESRGTASRWWSRAGDEFVPVTIRTAQAVIGAPVLLQESIVQASEFGMIIHLGDALDVSCSSEWDIFAAVMRSTSRPWMFVPGNHDGFIVGNFYASDDSRYNKGYWIEVCNAGRYYPIPDHHLAKEQVLKNYVALQRDILPAGRAMGSGVSCDPRNQTDCMLWGVDLARPWASYVVQARRLPAWKRPTDLPIYVVALDTSSYQKQPIFSPFSTWAGVEGGFSAAQLEAVAKIVRWLPANSKFLLIGHHDLPHWPQSEDLDRVFKDARFLRLVVTAHTHKGYWSQQVRGGVEVVELNIGSLIDAPTYFRDLSIERLADGRFLARSQRIVLDPKSLRCTERLPSPDEIDSIERQSSESDRLANVPALFSKPIALVSAVGHWLAFWQSKHQELDPQLAAFARLVNSLPDDEPMSLTYRLGDNQQRLLTSKQAVVGKLRFLATCDEGESVECSVQGKGRIMQAAEQMMSPFGGATLSATAIERLRRARLCTAAIAVWASTPQEVIRDILKQTEVDGYVLPAAPDMQKASVR